MDDLFAKVKLHSLINEGGCLGDYETDEIEQLFGSFRYREPDDDFTRAWKKERRRLEREQARKTKAEKKREG